MAEEDNVPKFAFTEEQLAKFRSELGMTEDDVPAPDNVIELPPQPVKRKRGRPRKHPVSETGTTVKELAEEEAAKSGITLPPAKLGKRDEKEVSERLMNILMGGTGVASQAKEYLAMTEEEAKAISDPLASYLVRNADTIPVANQILENYDLLAITLGVLAYVVRVFRERSNELAETRANQPDTRSETLNFVAEHTGSSNGGQAEGSPNFISTPYG